MGLGVELRVLCVLSKHTTTKMLHRFTQSSSSPGLVRLPPHPLHNSMSDSGCEGLTNEVVRLCSVCEVPRGFQTWISAISLLVAGEMQVAMADTPFQGPADHCLVELP